MAQADVLREFLVGLGFKVDQSGMKRFQGSVEGVTKTVATLGTAVAAAATAVSAAVVKIASNLDNVYFASQRTKASVQNINALKYAAQQVGLSADTAMGALNSLASFMRSSPAASKWIEKLGVATTDKFGKERDRAEMLMDVGNKLKEMPEFQAIHYGKFLGMDENFVLALREGKFDDFFAKYKAMSKDANLDKAAKDANKFMTSLRGLIEEFKLLGIQVQAALLGKAGEAMAKFKTWFDDNKPRIVKALTEISTILITIATEVIPVMVGALEIFVKLDEATDGWSTKVLLLAAAFRTLGGVAAFKFLMAGGAMAKMVAGRIFGAAGLALYSSDLNKGEDEQISESRAKAVKGDSAKMVRYFMTMGWSEAAAKGIVANLHHESGLNNKAVGDNGKAYGLAQWHPDRQENFKKVFGKDIRESTESEQLAFVHYELTKGKEKAAGQELAKAKTAEEAARIVTYKYERPANADKDAETRAKTASTLKVAPVEAMYPKFENDADPKETEAPKPVVIPPVDQKAAENAAKTADTLKTASANNQSTANGGLGYSAFAGNTYNQGKEVTINQNTTINVEGGADARETARNVSGAQAALNGNLVRNLRGAMA